MLLLMNIHKKNKIALVLSGGGIKAAAYHIGVCLALKEKGFIFAGGPKELVRQKFPLNSVSEAPTIRLYVGSSAGAFVAAVLGSGRSLESLITAFQVGAGTALYYDLPKEEHLKPIGYRHLFNLNSKGLLSWLPKSLLQKSLLT